MIPLISDSVFKCNDVSWIATGTARSSHCKSDFAGLKVAMGPLPVSKFVPGSPEFQ